MMMMMMMMIMTTTTTTYVAQLQPVLTTIRKVLYSEETGTKCIATTCEVNNTPVCTGPHSGPVTDPSVLAIFSFMPEFCFT
jgi:hypothetical protein